MPRLNTLSLQLAAFPLVLLLASSALAQDPVYTKKPPNVLLVVDSSGSMEYKSGTSSFPDCTLSEKSRWVNVIEALAGTITNYSCEKVDRSLASFKTMYGNGAFEPLDANYRNPYHKPYSNSCAYTPDSSWYAQPNAYSWVSPKATQSSGIACASAFSPFSGTGALNAYTDLVRFGLMTFDTVADPATGIGSGNAIDYPGGVKGAWSYFVGTSASGHPVDCSDAQAMEVGARNGAAPPWEGRLIPFGDIDASSTDNKTRHSRISQVLMSTRPYGATPIAGALQDARDFLWNDSSVDPLDITKKFGPGADPYIAGDCRDQSILLLTDGEPNMDMRDACEKTSSTDPALNGKCPYAKPEEIAGDLKNGLAGPNDNGVGPKKSVKTYVVGFAKTTSDLLYGGVYKDCNTMPASDWNTPAGECNTVTGKGDASLQVCCRLHRIAEAGGTTRAVFASDATALANTLDAMVASTLIGYKSTGTQPVTASVGTKDISPATNKTVAYKILTSFKSGTQKKTGSLWPGYIERARWVCDNSVPKLQALDKTYGDDIGATMAANPAERYFVTFVAEDSGSGVRHSDRTLRPFLPVGVTDGSGSLKGTQVHQKGTSFISLVPEKALKIPAPYLTAPTGCNGLTEVACRDHIMKWLLGYDNGSGNHRCPNAADCSLLADVLHSTPVVVERPAPTVPDDSYRAFAETTLMQERPHMMYSSTNDGLLHGIFLSANADADKPTSMDAPAEKFAFIPPLALTQISAQYPGTHQKVLDGAATVRDVVATSDASFPSYPYKLERDATATQATTSTWRTILVQSFGGGNSGYYAIDVTNPRVSSVTSEPRFLWQLTTDETGAPLFGPTPGKPLITTLNINSKEVAVAILPGGYGTASGSPTTRGGSYSNIAAGYDPAGLPLRNYGSGPTPARSLTVVRLDSGEIIRTFRRSATEVPANMASRVIATPLDAPLTGEAAAYPYLLGAVSDRVFVGDQDGTLWKVDFSKPDPTQWTMELFFDAYVKASAAALPAIRRPITNPPVLSVDLRGQVTIAFSTGDQDLSGAPGDANFLWSLTETVNSASSGFVAKPNWYKKFDDGKHVLGPIQLSSGVLYFATVQKASSACLSASSEVWGLDYVNPQDTADLTKGGRFALKPTTSSKAGTTVDALTAADIGLDADTVIFGVSLEPLPSCVASSSSTDGYLGGSRTRTSIGASPTPTLTFQTGAKTTSKSGLNFTTNFETVGLASAVPTSTNESWAAILD